MIEWAEWSDAEAATKWDVALTALPNYNLYQSYGWGEFKRRHGWSIRRGSVVINGAQVAMAQCLVREIQPARIVVAWVPGGPAGSLTGWLELGTVLQRRYHGRAFYLRANILLEGANPEYVKALSSTGWVPASVLVGTPLTFHLDLTPDETVRRRALTGNWRHNLQRGEQRGSQVELWEGGRSMDVVYGVYQRMAWLKDIAQTFTLDDLRAMQAILSSSFTLAVAIANDGYPCAIRGFAKLGTRAHDLIAGVSEKGRKLYAGYLLMWRLLQCARDQGVVLYDLSGADPKAPGVFNFKKGLGGQQVHFVGEWDWSTSLWLRRGVNLATRFWGI